MSDVFSTNQTDVGAGSSGTDTFTETTSQNYFQRLAGSFGAAAFGLVVFLVAIAILAWNESRAVDAIRCLGQAAKETIDVSPAPIDPARNDRLVHLTGDLKSHAPLGDPAVGFSASGIVRLRRTVEMYQWKETEQTSSSSQFGGTETKRTTYTYARKWSETPIESSDFKVQEHHRNPAMPLRTKTVTANDATIGPRLVMPALLDNLDAFEPAPAPAQPPTGFKRSGDALYKGWNPDMPAVGDLRVTFSDVPDQQVSVVAQQRNAALAPFRAKSGYTIALVVAGDQSAEQMVADARSKEKVRTWIFRAVGFVLFVFALLFMTAPLSALANVVPAFASIVSGGILLFAVALAVPLTLATIAIAWIAVRPIFGASLLLAAAACVYAYRHTMRRRRPAPLIAPTGAPPAPA